MSLSITQIKAKVTPKLRGTTLNRVSNFYDLCQEASENVVARAYPLETIRSSRIEGAIYSHVYNYVVNQDLRGNKGIIDIRPIAQRSKSDDIEGRFGREFDIKKDSDTFTVEVINSIKTLRLSKIINSHIVLSEMESLSLGEYVVEALGDVENLDTSHFEYVSGNSSIKFGLSGATGTGAIKITLPSNINLEEVEDIGALFNWMNFADVSRLASVKLKWGTNDANYWHNAVVRPSDRVNFESQAWTLQRFDWSGATKVGTPDVTATKYLEIEFTYSTGSAIANCYLDAITASVGQPYELVYYSNRFFKSTTGEYKEKPTDDSDVLNIGQEGHNLFLYELMLILIQELGQKAISQNSKYFQEQLNGYGVVDGLYTIYNKSYPSQAIPKSMTYYEFGNNSDDE